MLDLVLVSVRRVLGDRRGISAIEYGVLGAVVVVAVAALSTQVDGVFDKVFSTITAKVPT
ncbi:hypothetical protein [Falsiroseomonas oryzae]|uniref:hypothetical protein n=1 Tax=Falsiroseomonas oryzae TaxID=2766473 RepID=UPI0022EB91DC|nr:hypothetical protein [Roseomonas sp. MO-31]